MAWNHRYTQPRPTQERLYVERVPVPDTTCPSCGSSDIARYPVANHFGPRMATKCQKCLHILAMDRPTDEDNWPPFRSVTYDWKASPGERAARDALLRELAAIDR
ncbi:hypothetical protein [Actinacidiphila oryziradicis]|jgi:hypothetical protein|uniref:hypothetical protein n=1 Tax=Actinacidiphila oryziradicis TaxID=2571141 RepID=UPI0023F2BE38|nr:hypothetical protein [Actinacidiphila oryziradicis]MCW2874547.1 hypothetical protein [Actinacidiphila oryziradicis]